MPGGDTGGSARGPRSESVGRDGCGSVGVYRGCDTGRTPRGEREENGQRPYVSMNRRAKELNNFFDITLIDF